MTLLRISPDHLQVNPSCILLQPAVGSKTDRQGHLAPAFRITEYTPDKSICPFNCLRNYLERSAEIRREDEQLFISPFKPHKAVRKATLARWIASVLIEAGINATPGSIRATSASHARAAGVSIKTIMESADWSRASTFANFYSKTIPSASLKGLIKNNDMQNAVLGFS